MSSSSSSSSPPPPVAKSALGRDTKVEVDKMTAEEAKREQERTTRNFKRGMVLCKTLYDYHGIDLFHLRQFAMDGIQTTVCSMDMVTEWYMDAERGSYNRTGRTYHVYVETNEKERFVEAVKLVHEMHGHYRDMDLFTFARIPDELREGLRVVNGGVVGEDAPYDAKWLGRVTWKAPFKNIPTATFEEMLIKSGDPHPETVKSYAALRLRAFATEAVVLEAVAENIDSCEDDEDKIREAINEHFASLKQENTVVDVKKFVEDVQRKRDAYKQLTAMFCAATEKGDVKPLLEFLTRRRKRDRARVELEKQLRLVETLSHPTDWLLDKAEDALFPPGTATTDKTPAEIAAAAAELEQRRNNVDVIFLNPDNPADTRHDPSCPCHFCAGARRATEAARRQREAAQRVVQDPDLPCSHGHANNRCSIGDCGQLRCVHGAKRNACEVCYYTCPHELVRKSCAACRCQHGNFIGACGHCDARVPLRP